MLFRASTRFTISFLLVINVPTQVTSFRTHGWKKSPLISLHRSSSFQKDAEIYPTKEDHSIHKHQHPFFNNGDEKDKIVIHPLSELQSNSYQTLLEAIPSSVQIVLIGEGTHGTEEFFRIRSEITQALLKYGIDGDSDGSFDAILCEGDVSPFLELNNFVAGKNSMESDSRIYSQNHNIRKGEGNDDDEDDGIHLMLTKLFQNSFPSWMWSNIPMEEFVSYLKSLNESRLLEGHLPIQLLGMDIQSPFASMDFIIRELTAMGQMELAAMAQTCYGILSSFRPNIRKYGDAIYGSRIQSQEKSVFRVMDELSNATSTMRAGGYLDFHESQKIFEVLHCAQGVVASENYHRQRIYPGHVTTWNLRTNFFMDSIMRIRVHLSKMKQTHSAKSSAYNSPGMEKNATSETKLIIWAHNSHIGDMRETGYSSLGQISLGQLCRQRFGEEKVFLIGMTTYEGEVRAAVADRQGACFRGEGEVQTLTAALEDSHEFVLHSASMKIESDIGETSIGLQTRCVMEHKNVSNSCVSGNLADLWECKRRERFVGSCYLPHTEILSHYSHCNIARQFDYLFHVDKSSALSVRDTNRKVQ